MHSPLTLEAPRAVTHAESGSKGNDSPLQRILYVTSEIADYVKAGGLGEVSAALPRTLRQEYDARVLIPGYRQVLDKKEPMSVVARLPGVRGMPGCEIGRMEAPDGLVVYVVGADIHVLRLRDGRRTTIRTTSRSAVEAAVTSAGLFYALHARAVPRNQLAPFRRNPATVVFLRRAAILLRLR